MAEYTLKKINKELQEIRMGLLDLTDWSDKSEPFNALLTKRIGEYRTTRAKALEAGFDVQESDNLVAYITRNMNKLPIGELGESN